MPVKICIYGAGGVGSYLAVMFAQSGLCEVSVIARGKNLDAICRDGLALESEAGCFRIHSANCVANARELPQQDFVFVTVKAHDLPAIAHEIDSLVAPGGAAIFANNGIPWWWNHGLERGDGPLPTVDPDGRLWKLLGPEKAIGCVLYSANELISPGKVRHLGNNRWLVGEPTGVRSRRILTLTELMQGAGLHADIAEDLRLAIWTKLLRNAPFNSLCALTRLTADQFRSVPELSQLAQGMIDEVVAIAASKGWTLPRLDSCRNRAIRRTDRLDRSE
jgi:2-dehydropantoate 2-reductase